MYFSLTCYGLLIFLTQSFLLFSFTNCVVRLFVKDFIAVHTKAQ